MAEKDTNEEELDPQGQDNVNDADDSFGLPDLEYKPLDEASETENAETDVDGEVEATSGTEETEDAEDAEESTDNYSYDSTDEDETNTQETSNEEEETPEFRYQIEESSSNAPKIIGGIIGVIILAGAIWYFGFYRPQQQILADEARAKQELIDAKKAEEAATLKAAQDAEAAEAAETARIAAEAEEFAKAGVQVLEERTGRYYIVLESFIDADFAKDFGDRVAKEGTPSFLIPPYSKKKMQRVGIGGYESMEEAQLGLNDLPAEFGTGKWILKY